MGKASVSAVGDGEDVESIARSATITRGEGKKKRNRATG